MAAPTSLLAALALLLAAVVALRLPDRVAAGARGWAMGRSAPLVLGLLTVLALGWVAGGGLRVTPISTDENAYLLQAHLLADGRIAGAPAPIPDFFEQPWVIVTPRTYAKYPPGQALTLAPGVALGLPWLMPALLLVVTGALVFVLARRLAGPGGALLAWSGWVLAPMTMAWQSSYFSEITSAAGWLVAAWAGLRWHDGRGRRWLVLVALALGWTAVTRPFTALLLGLPLGIALLVAIVRRRAWGDLVAAAAAGCAVLALLPVWYHATTGHWTESPLSVYTTTYLPWDRLGFAIDSTPPLRPPAADFAPIAHHMLQVHHEHTVAALPRTFLDRVEWTMGMTWSGWRLLLVPLALVGFAGLETAGWLAFVSAVLLFLGHLVWGHEAGWTLYYAEGVPVWFLLAGAGAGWLAKRAWREAGESRLALTLLLALPALGAVSLLDARGYRSWRARRAADSQSFADLVAREPGRSIFFVREADDGLARPVLVANDPDWADAPAWIVHDLGPRNAELQRLAPDRTAWLVERSTGRVLPLPPPGPR